MSVSPVPPQAGLGRGPDWITWPLRSAAVLHLFGVLTQAVLAGLFVTGDVDMLAWHRTNGGFTHVMLYLQLVASILLWRPARGPAWPALAAAGLVAAETLQVMAGQERVLAVHFPLGMAVFGATTMLTVLVWQVTR
ncbi:hypothetical protein AAH991_14885 [Microbispora sp. ZYX-F-249]|uniref:Uncharacterized protein n=1 Tax=Microbispora maris TaxID=3144104 RepID=A0ABV0AM76_9ACTN